MQSAPDDWEHIIQFVICKMGNNSITSVLGKVGVAACVYNLWREKKHEIISKCTLQ